MGAGSCLPLCFFGQKDRRFLPKNIVSGGGFNPYGRPDRKISVFFLRIPLEEGEGVGVPTPYGKCLIFPICLLPHFDKIQKNSSILLGERP